MNSDKELLELAAKAAGIETTPYYGANDEFYGLVVNDTGYVWNPLEDTQDAFPLTVKLKLDIEFGLDYVWVHWVKELDGICEGYKEDPYAATRRAIVKAAAEIGRSMG